MTTNTQQRHVVVGCFFSQTVAFRRADIPMSGILQVCVLKQASWTPLQNQPPALHHTKKVPPHFFSFPTVLMSFVSFSSFFVLKYLQATAPYLSSTSSPLRHPAHPTISDPSCKLQAKLYQPQIKDKLLPSHAVHLSPTHCSYPVIVLANNRTQASAVFSIMRNTCTQVQEELLGRTVLP